MESSSRPRVQVTGNRPNATTGTRKGRIIEAAAPDAKVAARAASFTDLRERLSILSVNNGNADATALTTGNRSFVIEDFPIT